MNTNFYGLWRDPTANRTRTYLFSTRRSIHLTIDRLTSIAYNKRDRIIIGYKLRTLKLVSHSLGLARPVVVGESIFPTLSTPDVIGRALK